MHECQPDDWITINIVGRGLRQRCTQCGAWRDPPPPEKPRTRRVPVKQTGSFDRETFRAKRQALGYSQTGLAELIGVTREHVNKWESGRKMIPRYATLILELLEQTQKENTAP